MQIDTLALRLRPREQMEAADLGIRLCQRTARSLYPCLLTAAIPLAVLAIVSYEIAAWLPAVVLWWTKPWLDRTILFVLSRSAFGQDTRVADLWKAKRQVWWSQLLLMLTIQRFSPWRSLTQPVYQLEGSPVWRAGARVRQIRRRTAGAALAVTTAFYLSEFALYSAVLSLAYWLTPAGAAASDVMSLITGTGSVTTVVLPLAYGACILFVEPFYVAAGFSLYLHRRADLEAWDIEQEFRRAFIPTARRIVASLAAILIGVSCVAATPLDQADTASGRERPPAAEITRAVETVKADPNLATERSIKMLRWKRPESKPADLSWLQWLVGFIKWLDQSARALIWLSALVLGGLVAVYLVRMLRGYEASPAAEPLVEPTTHVRDLDIRPESLPQDIGGAARAMWDRGDHRASLALLYRGLLSRLVHVHKVPIRDSSTEGDCLALAVACLPTKGSEYAAVLVPLWQRFVYGGQSVPTDSVHLLCDGFAPALNLAPVSGASGRVG